MESCLNHYLRRQPRYGFGDRAFPADFVKKKPPQKNLQWYPDTIITNYSSITNFFE